MEPEPEPQPEPQSENFLMEEIASECDAAAAEAFAGLTEAYGLIAEIQGQSNAEGHSHAQTFGLKIDAEQEALYEMPTLEREKTITQRLDAAYESMRKFCKHLHDARAKLIEAERRVSGLKVSDPELDAALHAYSEAEREVEICEIAASAAEDDVRLRVEQRRRELHSIYGNTAEAQDKICGMVAGMMVEMEAIKKTANCVDTLAMS